jgi:hypothetical protein
MVRILRKRFDILKRSLVILIIFIMFGLNVVSGVQPDNNDIETEEMVNKPEHYKYSWFLESINSGAGSGFGRVYQHELFFYNFTVMSNSTSSVVFTFKEDFEYNPSISDMTLAPGESFGGNFTYIGEYDSSGTKFMDFECQLESAGNATIIYELIIWDTYVYRMGTTGYIVIGSLGGAFILFIVFYLFFYNKGKSSPKL